MVRILGPVPVPFLAAKISPGVGPNMQGRTGTILCKTKMVLGPNFGRTDCKFAIGNMHGCSLLL